MQIYYNIRESQRRADALAEGQWRARFPEFKRTYLNQFLKHTRFVSALDDILIMPGHRHGLTMYALHVLLYLKCDEVSFRI